MNIIRDKAATAQPTTTLRVMRRLITIAALIGALLTAGCETKLGKTPVCEDPNLEPRTRVVKNVHVCRCVKPGEKWAPIDGGPKCDYVKKGDK